MNGNHVALLALTSVLMFVVCLALLAIIIASIPDDYFTTRRRELVQASGLRFIVVALKNVVGLLVILAGFVMLIGPGPGMLTILMGSILVDFLPGKRWIELTLARRRSVMWMLNRMRFALGRRPFAPPV